MYGATISIFRNIRACQHIKQGLEIETNEEHIIVSQVTDMGIRIYKVIEKNDLKFAQKEGWEIF